MDQPQSNGGSANFQAAIRAFGARNWPLAEDLCRRVLLADPQHADALHMLGLVLNATGRSADAITILRQAAALQPDSASLWSNLGETYRTAGQFDDAVACQLQALGLQPNFPESLINLSLAYRGAGQYEDGIQTARRAADLRPGVDRAHFNLGNLLRENGQFRDAVAAYQAALQLRPDWIEAHLNIAAAWYSVGEYETALGHYKQALQINPDCSAALHSGGHSLRALGRIEEAKTAYARAAALDGSRQNPMSALFRETLAEAIAPDYGYIESYKRRVVQAVRGFAAEASEIELARIDTRAAVPSIQLAYYGGDARPIMEQYARAIGPLIPRIALRARQGKPKLGVVVTHGHEAAFSRCWGGIAERLSRELFDVRIVCSRGGAQSLQSALNVSLDEYILLPETTNAAQRLLHEQEFDWLHYWEIGTDPMNYYLPFFRAAPGQSAGWGWPVTSGNSLVTAYLSCEQLEPPQAASHYTERVIRLKHLPTYYVRPSVDAKKGRDHFGLEASARVYLCVQNLRKFHPNFDPLLADLLRTDPRALLLIIEDVQTSITKLLLARFARAMPDVISRIRVVHRMGREEYLSLISAADVVLDTPHYGAGANTAYDAVAMGTPMITLPGEFHRARWAAAVNRRLGVPQLIAQTPREYVAAAVEVANNSDLRRGLRQQILDAGAELFEDAAVVHEHEAYFSQAIADSRQP